MTSERFNTELQTKNKKDPKDYWKQLKSFNQDQGKKPIAKSVLFDHFKTLNSPTSPHHSNHGYPPCETIVNPNTIENCSVEEVTACLKKMQNGKSAGHDDVFSEFEVLESGVVPLDWALSIYRPLYKKANKKEPNY